MSFAERLQQSAEANSIHVSEDVYLQLKDLYKFEEVPEGMELLTFPIPLEDIRDEL